MSKPVSRVCNVRVAGPLAPFAADFTSRLEELGYTPLTRVNELRLMAHLSRWLEASQLTGADLDGERIGLFLSAQRAGGYGAPGAAGGPALLLEGPRGARAAGVGPRPAPPGSGGGGRGRAVPRDPAEEPAPG